MKVFIDSNVWISAYAGSGICAELVIYVRQRHQIICHALVLQEYEKNMLKKFKVDPWQVAVWIADIKDFSTVHDHTPEVKQRTRDPKDDPILQAALDADCDWLVSGDADLTSLKRVKGMPITTPRDFLEALGVEEPWI